MMANRFPDGVNGMFRLKELLLITPLGAEPNSTSIGGPCLPYNCLKTYAFVCGCIQPLDLKVNSDDSMYSMILLGIKPCKLRF